MENAIYTAIGFVLGWLITYQYYKKAIKHSENQNTKNINRQRFESSLQYYIYLLESGTWNQKVIENKDVYVCQENPLYQIDISDEGRKFNEQWTRKLPDASARLFDIKLKSGQTVIETYKFVSADGERYIVPLPQIILDQNKEPIYYWRKNSPQYFIAGIIGNYYRDYTLEEVANTLKIEIFTERK